MKLMPHSPASERQAIDPGIFREYDIRGISGETLRVDDVYRIARAYASQIKKENAFICIGRDGRISSPALAEAACRGVSDCGIDAIDIGIGPTPMLYFAAHTLKADAGIMITGSHNPPNHNGLKFVFGGKPFFGADIKALHGQAMNGKFRHGKGVVKQKDVSAEYVALLLAAFEGRKGINVIWDAGNGAAGAIMTELCKHLPGNHIALNALIDGRFPNHHPDPSVAENLYQLVDEVKKHEYDIGIAFDGDGDRVGLIDDEGFIIWPDQFMILLAQDVLADNPGAAVIADVKSSAALFDAIRQYGGVPIMWKTGHSHIKAKLAETGAKLAGEMSGHIFFADKYFGYDDALYAAVRILAVISKRGLKLSEWRKTLPAMVNTPEMRFACDDDKKFKIIDEVSARLKVAGTNFSDVDGIRVSTSDGWWLLRASNTQPMLVARCEAATQAGLDHLMALLRAQLTASGVRLPSKLL